MIYKDKFTITIIYTDCLIHISKILKIYFENKGWLCNLVHNKHFSYDTLIMNKFHIYLFYYLFLDPKKLAYVKYIIYQLEQNTNNNISFYYNGLIKNNILEKIFKNAKLCLDYAEQNINVINNKFNIKSLLLPVPILYNSDIIELYNKNINKKYDIIFIGKINERRNNIIHLLLNKYNILLLKAKLYDIKLSEKFRECKILLNLHSFEDAILERVRLNEGIESGIRIISEKPNILDMEICKDYEYIVDFIEIIKKNDITELCNKIDSILLNNNIINNEIMNDKILNLNNNFINKCDELFTDKLFID
jgi:hypothetical protein